MNFISNNRGFVPMLKDVILGVFSLIIGFAMGTVIDVAFFATYKKIDPLQKSISKLVTITLLQTIVIMIVIVTGKDWIKGLEDNIFQTGLISSQIFMVSYSITRLSTLVSSRELGVSPPPPTVGLFRSF